MRTKVGLLNILRPVGICSDTRRRIVAVLAEHATVGRTKTVKATVPVAVATIGVLAIGEVAEPNLV